MSPHSEDKVAFATHTDRSSGLIAPYAGPLVDLLADDDRRADLHIESRDWPSIELSPRQICDLELLLNGGFSPLGGFMGRADYESVCHTMRLGNGVLWPIPVTLDMSDEMLRRMESSPSVALRDPEGVMLAVLHVADIWQPDKLQEAQSIYGTTSSEHPGVQYLLERSHRHYVGGRLEGMQLPSHYDFSALRQTPAELRQFFNAEGWNRIVAFQTSQPMHRAQYEMTLRAARECDANMLIHPAVGTPMPGSVDHYTRVRCYEALLPHYSPEPVKLSLLPLAVRMAGPREALWHAIINRNYGCTHLIVGPNHGDPGRDTSVQSFYRSYDAQRLVMQHEAEIGIQIVPFKAMTYAVDLDGYFQVDEIPNGSRSIDVSGPELRRKILEGRTIPDWYTFNAVVRELRRTYPPRSEQGFTLFFTGLSGAGKSTIANIALAKLLEIGGRPVTLLDGDVVRKHLSSELGFSKEHRDINVRRIGFVASEITKNGGIAICAPIAPYDAVRRDVREMVEKWGGFVLVHVSTPLEICEIRDRKGLYAKARAGLVKHFTGISDPYEIPLDAEVALDTTGLTPEQATEELIRSLVQMGYIEPSQRIPVTGDARLEKM